MPKKRPEEGRLPLKQPIIRMKCIRKCQVSQKTTFGVLDLHMSVTPKSTSRHPERRKKNLELAM